MRGKPRSVIHSDQRITPFDSDLIQISLEKEAGLSEETALRVAKKVKNKLSRVKALTGPLIREMACSVLISEGLLDAREKYSRIGMAVKDYEKLLGQGLKENSNQISNPESIHNWCADRLSSEYSLMRVIPRELSLKHLKGDLYIHMLRYFDMRPFCQEFDPRMILSHGFPPVPFPHSVQSKPANTGVVAALHLAKWLGFITQEFSGGLGFDNFNVALAPYTRGLSDREIHQIAQCFVYEVAQIYASRGAQVPFTSITTTPGVSGIMSSLPAIGPGGLINGVYGDYEEESNRLFNAFTDVFIQGDANGHLFNFPKHEVKLSPKWMETYEDSYRKVMVEAATQGTPYFLNQCADWLPDEVHSQCCRIILTPEGMKKVCRDLSAFDWMKNYMNMGSLQSVSLNLPRYAYESRGDETRFFEILKENIESASKILLLKRNIVEERMKSRILYMCASEIHNTPILDMRKQSVNIGFIGLNECVQCLTGSQLHENRGSFDLGMKILRFLSAQCDILSADHKFKFSLWEQPAESSSQKMALLDMKYYPSQAKKFVRGSPGTQNIYYTNSGHLNYEADIPLHKRIAWQGEEHPVIQGGVITHVFLGESHPDPDALWNLTQRIANGTQTGYFAYTLEHTQCMGCHKMFSGIQPVCPSCGAPEELLEYWSRITGYYSRVKQYNPGKLEEWKNRHRYTGRVEMV